MPATPAPTFDDLFALPKVDLFRRLGGALDAGALADLRGPASPHGQDSTPGLTSVDHWITGSWPTMQARMAAVEAWMASAQLLQPAVQAITRAAEAEAVAHVELAVSPTALVAPMGSLEAAVDGLSRALPAQPPEASTSVGWLLDVAASEPMGELARIAELALDHREAGVLGLAVRLAVDNASAADALLAEARQAGLSLQVQLWPDLEVDAALPRLEEIRPSRIAFGGRLIQSLDALGWIRERRPAMVVCPSSESALGQPRQSASQMLMGMIQAGMQVSLATWAPGPLGRSLTDEYLQVAQELGFSLESLRGLTLAGVQGSFLTKGLQRRLERQFEASIFGFPPEA
jgi:aminodeoxyfutalosine deaminase